MRRAHSVAVDPSVADVFFRGVTDEEDDDEEEEEEQGEDEENEDQGEGYSVSKRWTLDR